MAMWPQVSIFVLKFHITLALSPLFVLVFKPVDVKVSFDSQTTSPEFSVLLSGVEWLRSSDFRHQKWWRNVDNQQ